MTALTQEEFAAGITALQESLNKNLSAGFESLGTTLRESLAPAAVAEVVVTDPAAAVVEVTEAVTIDHAEVIAAITEAGLPSQVAGAVVAALQEGKTVAEAIEAQTKLKEAFASTEAPANRVRIVEAAANEPTGSLADRILATLGNK